MKIGIVGPRLDDSADLGTVAYEYPGFGMECRVFCPTSVQSLKGVTQRTEGVASYHFVGNKGSILSSYDYHMLSKLLAWADIVHVYHCHTSLAGLTTTLAKKRYKKPVIVTPANCMEHGSALHRLSSRITLSLADWLVCWSHQEQQWFLEKGIPRKKLLTIRRGCNLQFLKQVRDSIPASCDSTNPTSKIRFLATARTLPRRNFHRLLLTFEKLNQLFPDQSELTIIASDPRDSHYGTLQEIVAAKSQIRRHVTLLPAVPQTELCSYYAATDVHINPSLGGRFGLTSLEALAFGVPVIVSEQLGVAEQVRGAQGGITCKTKREHDLLNPMIAMLDHSFRGRFTPSLQKIASYSTMTAELKALYSDCTGSGSMTVA